MMRPIDSIPPKASQVHAAELAIFAPLVSVGSI